MSIRQVSGPVDKVRIDYRGYWRHEYKYPEKVKEAMAGIQLTDHQYKDGVFTVNGTPHKVVEMSFYVRWTDMEACFGMDDEIQKIALDYLIERLEIGLQKGWLKPHFAFAPRETMLAKTNSTNACMVSCVVASDLSDKDLNKLYEQPLFSLDGWNGAGGCYQMFKDCSFSTWDSGVHKSHPRPFRL